MSPGRTSANRSGPRPGGGPRGSSPQFGAAPCEDEERKGPSRREQRSAQIDRAASQPIGKRREQRDRKQGEEQQIGAKMPMLA